MRQFNPEKIERAKTVDAMLRAAFPLMRRFFPPAPAQEAVQRLLVYESWMLGDFIMATPAARFLKTQYPDAKIDCVCPPVMVELAAFVPYIDTLIPFVAPWSYQSERLSAKELSRAFAILRRLRAARYDWAFDLRGDLRDILFLYLTGASRRAAFDTTGGRYLLSHVVPYANDKYAHQLEGNMLVVSQPLGLEFTKEESIPELIVPARWRDAAKRWLTEQGIGDFVAVCPGASSLTKAWPADRWAELLQRYVLPGREVVIFGVPSERAVIQEVLVAIGGSRPPLHAEVPLPLLCALLAESTYTLTLDSMAGHLAAAVGTPVVSIHGPRAPDLCRPYGRRQEEAYISDVPCRNCHQNRCTQPRNFCILDLPVEDVAAAIHRLGLIDERSRDS